MNQNEPMNTEELEFVLKSTQQAAGFSLDGLHQVRSRAHALLLVLLSGGAGMGSLGLSQWALQPALALALLAASVWWFCAAGWLVWRALVSGAVQSWASGQLLPAHQDWCRYRDELVAEGQLGQADTVDVLRELKMTAIRTAASARAGYIEAGAKAYAAVDLVLKSIACTPLVAAAPLLVRAVIAVV